jgi:hypothetical protein
MKEQRVNIGVMGLPWLKRALQDQARREGRTTSNLAERLLIWSMRQLRAAGDSQTLAEWEARPGSRKGRKVNARGIYQEVTEQAEDFARAAREMAERPHEGAHEQRPTVSKEDAARHPGRPRRRAHS